MTIEASALPERPWWNLLCRVPRITGSVVPVSSSSKALSPSAALTAYSTMWPVAMDPGCMAYGPALRNSMRYQTSFIKLKKNFCPKFTRVVSVCGLESWLVCKGGLRPRLRQREPAWGDGMIRGWKSESKHSAWVKTSVQIPGKWGWRSNTWGPELKAGVRGPRFLISGRRWRQRRLRKGKEA